MKNAPSKYARAYLYTETDDSDTTYFLDYNLSVILRAIASLREYLSRKASEIQHVDTALGNTVFSRQLNYRQLAVVSHAIRNPGEIYTIESHRSSHNVTYPTARADLLKLAELGLLDKKQSGNTFLFEAVEDMNSHIEQYKKDH